jgi:DNA-binding transcriptional MerR regulator
MQDLPPTKRYYTISEVAKIFGVSVPKLRFWEDNFPSLKIQRNRAGDRVFQQKDLEHLRMIYELVEERRFTLEGARNYIKTKQHKQPENAEVIARLQKLRGFLLQLREDIAEAQKNEQKPDRRVEEREFS